MKFVEGTEVLRDTPQDSEEYFKKGVPFAGGRQFPLVRGKVQKVPEDKEGVLDYMYAVREDGKENS